MDTRRKNEIEKENELATLFDKQKEAEFIANSAKVAAFLMDKEACTRQLKKLNAKLVEKSSEGLSVNILRSILEDELFKVGFQPLLAKAVDELKPYEFRQTLKEKLMLKDIILGGSVGHGEFTHAIQWLMIAWEQQDNSDFLSKKACDFFQELGEDKAVFQYKPKEKNMWDVLVDATMTRDFRSPEWIAAFIRKSSDPDLQFLNYLLSLRADKRFQEETKTSWAEKHQADQGIKGKHTLFQKDEKIPNLLRPIERVEPKKK